MWLLLYYALPILLFLCAIFYIFLKYKYTYWTKYRVVQEPPQLFFGNIKKWMRQEIGESELIHEFYNKYKGRKYVGLYYFWKPLLLIRDAGLVKKALISDFDSFCNHEDQSTLQGTDSVLDSLFFQKDSLWKHRRQFFSKMFTPLRLKEFFDHIQGQFERIQPKFDMRANKGEDIYLESVVEKYALGVIASTFIGIEMTKEVEDKFVEMSHKILYLDLPTVVKSLALTLVPAIYKLVNFPVHSSIYWEYFEPLTKHLLKHKETDPQSRIDIFNFLLKLRDEGSPQGPVKLEELVGHVFSFYAAGTHTTELTLCFTLVALSRNPEIQEKAHEEVTAILQENKGLLTYETLQKFRYLDNIISETLRMYPLLGVVKRVCTKDYQLDEKLVVKKGTEVIIPVYSLQTDPKYFDQPEKFIPERWEDSSLKSSDAYLPFGKGPRICIGMKFAEMAIKFALVKIIQRYTILPSDNIKYPLTYDPRTFIISGRPLKGYWIKLSRRAER